MWYLMCARTEHKKLDWLETSHSLCRISLTFGPIKLNVKQSHNEGDIGIYPLGDVRVHHEIVNMFLCSGQLQLPGNHRHHQDRAAGSL